MTKKAKTKTKNDETPPTSVPSEKQSTEPGPGPGADQHAATAPPTPVGAGPAPLPPAAAQPEATKLQDSPAAAAAAVVPAAAAAPAATPGLVPTAAVAPATARTSAPTTAAAAAPAFAPAAAPIAAPAIVPTAAAAAALAVAAPAPASVPDAKSGECKTSEASSAPHGAQGQLGATGSPPDKPAAPEQEGASNNEPKPSAPVQSEPLKKQLTTPRPQTNNQPSTQPPVGDLALSLTSSEGTNNVPKDKSRSEKDPKPIAPPKAQDPGKDLTDKSQKVSPSTPTSAPNGQPSKKPAEKQNKRQAPKESVPSNSVMKGDTVINKQTEPKQSSHDKVAQKPVSGNEPKTAKDNTLAKVEEVTVTQGRDEPNKDQLDVAKSETLTKKNNESEAPKKKRDEESPKPKDSNKNIAAGTEDIKAAAKPEISKDQETDGKKASPDPAIQGNLQNPPSTKGDSSEKVSKNAASKKNKQKNEASASKTEGAPKSKEAKPADKTGKKNITTGAATAQTPPEVSKPHTLSTATDNSKKPSSNTLSDTLTKLPTLEAVASDSLTQAKEDANKLSQQTKVPHDSKNDKEYSIKDDAQSKSSSKKKDRQQKKSLSEEVKSSKENDSKSKKDEKKKPAAASPSKEKESNCSPASALGEKNRKNVPGESVTPGPKDSVAKSPMTEKMSLASAATKDSHLKIAEHDSSDKTKATIPESQSEEQSASKKKKRNRHKKKNKAGDGDNFTDANIEGGKQQDTNVTAVGGERKAKEKQQTTIPSSNKSKGQQKDSQQAQPAGSKGTQPGFTTTQDGQASSVTPEKQTSETTAQTASSKKRNRRQKKGTSEIEKDSDTIQLQECKSEGSKETSVAKPEEQKPKKTESKPTPKLEKPQQQDGQFTEGTEDQSENFVEVKSKNKRNKKKRLDSAEASNNVLKVVPENILVASENNSKGKMETENTGGDSAIEATNKLAAPKISQEAREQKMLNKKLAERAQLKIQKQIESNALSEVEKSEKYLETITKNLRELTKLRASRLEDVLQKSTDGTADEEFEYEYTPVQRNTFLATTCHVCKESKPKDTMRICEQCHLMSYCSEEHQKSDWSAHRDLCQAISEMCRERGTNNLYSPAVGLSPEDYRGYRMNALLECSAILNRQLEPYEQEILLYPNVCHTCHLPSATSLHTCDSCSMVSFCSPEHRLPNHDVWCHDLQLYKSLIIYQSRNGVINPQLPVFLPESFQPPNGDMQSHLRTMSGGIDASPLERAVLSEIATGPLTALFALHKSNKVSDTTEKLVIHFVGAEWSFEMERADKWEAFLLHLIPSLKALVLVFIGPEVCHLPPEARGLLQKQSRPCPQCQQKGRTVEVVIAPQLFYHEYVASQDYIAPSIICTYNAGLYRPNGHKDVDSWSDTVVALLKDPGVPVVVTSYTAEEVLKDAERLQHYRPLNFVLPPSQNPYRSLRPNRNFASDDVTPVIFKNYYIMISTSLAQ